MRYNLKLFRESQIYKQILPSTILIRCFFFFFIRLRHANSFLKIDRHLPYNLPLPLAWKNRVVRLSTYKKVSKAFCLPVNGNRAKVCQKSWQKTLLTPKTTTKTTLSAEKIVCKIQISFPILFFVFPMPLAGQPFLGPLPCRT